MSQPTPDLDTSTAIALARVAAAHGLHGELRLELQTDFPERFAPGATVWLNGTPYSVERFRADRSRAYLKLAEVGTREAAAALAGAEVQIPAAAAALAEGVYHVHDIVGLRVEARDGETLGELVEVLRTGANDVYVVEGPAGRLLLPAIDDVVKAIDLEGRRVVVELLEGLDFQRPKQQPARPRRRRAPARSA